MIPGFNHNIKHKGRIFHIQTEDSGLKNPHIITHLFVGGNILASKKTTYAEIVGKAGYESAVRSMMEEQHKQMLRNLVNGVFDAVEAAPSYTLDGPAPLNLTVPSPPVAGATGNHARPAGAARQESPALEFQRPAGGIPVTSTPAPVEMRERPKATPKSPPPGTIFGEDLISEKSLDEVILSYLAEDLAGSD